MSEAEKKAKIDPQRAMKATIGALGELSTQGNHKRIVEAANMPGATRSGEQLVRIANKISPDTVDKLASGTTSVAGAVAGAAAIVAGPAAAALAPVALVVGTGCAVGLLVNWINDQ